MDEVVQAVPQEEKIFVAGDLNGHVGVEGEARSRIHGDGVEGVGVSNEDGESILDCYSKRYGNN